MSYYVQITDWTLLVNIELLNKALFHYVTPNSNTHYLTKINILCILNLLALSVDIVYPSTSLFQEQIS